MPLVFLHGMLGRCEDWLSVCSFLPPCPCIAIDLPGHGLSPFSSEFAFIPPAKKFHLIGYSLGGRLAREYALRYPSHVESLCLISTHPGLAIEEERKERLQKDAAWAELIRQLPIEEFLKRWYDQPLFAGFAPDFATRRHQSIEGIALAFLHYSLGTREVVFHPGAIEIIGEKDRKFRDLLPNALMISGAGHAVHLENPGMLAQAIAFGINSI
ncbi:MAG: alpha/beta fold hydrolase [Chlamydiia bacterium]|nr:alpha/beta fold hydrolase [Chlamydiia bacterium]